MLRDSLALAARALGPASFSRLARRLASPLPAAFDRARLLAADAVFEQGDYVAALALYESTLGDRHGPRARQMADWIRFKLGDVSRGWPVYPGTRFDAAGLARGRTGGQVRVADPQRPAELVTHLGLASWDGQAEPGGPLLVWFNFRSSLGGELLAAKLVLRLRRCRPVPMVLACDPRLVDILAAAFPGDRVVSREADLAPLVEGCRRFLLARDALALVVRSPSDLDAVGVETLLPIPARPAAAGPRRIAFSWKTTNPRQARFRNLPVERLAAALGSANLELHSAQHGVDEADRRAWRRCLGDRVRFDTIDPSGSVGQMAAALARMDLVVTIDNTLLHVAGAAGLPAIGLLSVPSYWAWPIEGESSRWYPSVRLLHQARPGEWDPVMERLSRLLASEALP